MFENVLFEVRTSIAGGRFSRSFAALPSPCLVCVPRVHRGFARNGGLGPGEQLAEWIGACVLQEYNEFGEDVLKKMS